MANDVNVKITVDVNQANQATENYKKKLAELKQQMTALMVETDGLSKASAEQRQQFAQLEEEAGKITDAMGDASQRIKNLSDDYAGMTAAIQGVGAGVGAITAVNGALNLLGVESGTANEAIKKMTSLMGILNGLNSVAKVLNKDSALMTALHAKAQKSLNQELTKTTTAEQAGTAATATFTAAEGAATTGAITLKGAVKAVGTAIKSVPVVGWILAAIAAITTLISLISDANEEEEEGNRLRDKQIWQRQQILDQQQQALNLQRLENYDLQAKAKALETLDKNSIDYKDNLKEVAEYTGLSKEYIESLNGDDLANVVKQYGSLKDKQLELNQAQENYNNLIKQRQEIEEKTFSDDEDERNKAIADLKWMNNEQSDYHKKLEEANDKVISTQKEIAKNQRSINKVRQSELDYQNKSAEAEKKKQKAIEASKKAEQERQALIAQTEKELADLDKFIADQSKQFNDVLANIALEEVGLTNMYDNALDSAIKYYGEESEQVQQITALRIKALDELNKKRDEYTKDEQRKAQDEGLAIEESKLKGRIAGLEQGTEEYKNAQIEQDKQVEQAELIELQRHLDDKLISEEFYQSELDRITAEHNKNRADIEKEWQQIILEQKQQHDEEIKASEAAKWEAAKSIVTSFGTFLDAAMDAELEAVRGNEEKEKEVRRKYAKQRFLAQIGSIGVSTAQAIMEAWSSVAAIMFPGNVIAGGVLTAMLAATGIAQTVKAKHEMENALKAEKGGILVGRSHAQGGIMLSNGVEAEGGEAIINKRSTAAFAPLLSEINSYNGYGAPLIKNASYNGSNGFGFDRDMIKDIVAETVAGVTAIPVVVSEHNITEAQRNVGVTRERSYI